jgi:hypothetical protein
MKKSLPLLLFLAITSVQAQDLRGAYIRSSWVSGFTYSIQISLYAETAMNIARPTVSVNFGDNTSGTFTMSGSTTNGGTTIKQYSGTHTYAGFGNYIVSYLDTYRVAGITNMSSSQTQTLYVESRIYGSASHTPNAAPLITSAPVVSGMAFNPISYNPGCLDADGDSLNCLLVNCSGANYSTPPGTTFNNTNGTVSFVTNTPGLYAFSFLIYELRKNPISLVGISQLDFLAEVSGNVGLKETDATPSGLFLYPNPVKNKLTVNSPSGSIQPLRLLNTLGQIVLQTTTISPQQELDLSALPAGLYYLEAGNGSVQKVVKE